MAQLAIKGHPTRGNEVIEILEILGGKNYDRYNGLLERIYYYIDKDGKIECDYNDEIPFPCVYFTLEEFFEKFPYKIGNKILYKTYGIYSKIKTMLWNEEKEQVFYRLESNKLFVATADELQPRKEETIENKLDLLQQLKDYFDNTPREVVEKEWHEYDKYNEIGPTVDEYLEYVNKIRQPKYPKTYEECYKVLGKTNSFCFEGISLDEMERIRPFIKLLRCRNAYWKIAGEQLGLSKPWKQDYDDKCFIIANNNGNIHTYEYHGNNNVILTFPTKEMRDAFYENFKELIEECKEFL